MTTTTEEEEIVLGEWMGKPIIGSSGKFTSLGDGLSKAMAIEGGIDEQGDIVTFVVMCRVGPHTLALSEDEESYAIIHKYIGGTVARIDIDLVREVLVAMEARIKAKEDEEAKAGTLDGVDDAATEAASTTANPDGRKGSKSKKTTDEGYHDPMVDDPDAPNELVGAGVGGGSDAA